MSSIYNSLLVFLSLIVAFFASYTPWNCRAGFSAATGAATNALAARCGHRNGIGIWSMHFVGVMACVLPIRSRYDCFNTTGSPLGIPLPNTWCSPKKQQDGRPQKIFHKMMCRSPNVCENWLHVLWPVCGSSYCNIKQQLNVKQASLSQLAAKNYAK